MRNFLLILWIIAILIGTCTKNVHALLKRGEIGFDFVSEPQWSGAFSFYPLSEISKLETVGHFLMFFVLTALLLGVSGKPITAGVIAFSFGIMIEFIQPYFTRGADIYDVLADLLGVIASVVVFLICKRVARENWGNGKTA